MYIESILGLGWKTRVQGVSGENMRSDRAAGNSLAGNGNPLVSGYSVIKR